MNGYVNITSRFDAIRFRHAWRDGTGEPRASVEFGDSWVTFDRAEDARAAATECNRAADAMEALPPQPPRGTEGS